MGEEEKKTVGMNLKHRVKFGRFEVVGDIEIVQGLNPFVLVLEKVDSDGVRPEFMGTPGGRVRVIVHSPLGGVPVASSSPFSHPISEHFVLRPLQVLLGNL